MKLQSLIHDIWNYLLYVSKKTGLKCRSLVINQSMNKTVMDTKFFKVLGDI